MLDMLNQLVFAGPFLDYPVEVKLNPNGEKAKDKDEKQSKLLHVCFLVRWKIVLVAPTILVAVGQSFWREVIYYDEKASVKNNSLYEYPLVGLLNKLSVLVAILFEPSVVCYRVHDVHNVEEYEVEADPLIL